MKVLVHLFPLWGLILVVALAVQLLHLLFFLMCNNGSTGNNCESTENCGKLKPSYPNLSYICFSILLLVQRNLLEQPVLPLAWLCGPVGILTGTAGWAFCLLQGCVPQTAFCCTGLCSILHGVCHPYVQITSE